MPNRPEEWAAAIGAFAVLGGLLFLGILVVRDTVRRTGKWGINFRGLAGAECPRCDAPVPAVRVPKNRRQTLWGGWTCDECGCEIDKWGREVPSDDSCEGEGDRPDGWGSGRRKKPRGDG